MILAAIQDSKDMTRVLLKHKASVVAVDDAGCSALFYAAFYGNYEIVKMLVANPRTEINVKNKVCVLVMRRGEERGRGGEGEREGGGNEEREKGREREGERYIGREEGVRRER